MQFQVQQSDRKLSHKSQTLDVGWRRGGVYLCASFSTARHRGGNIGPLRCTAENHPINWAEGRALHAANDCGETLYWRIGVAYLASEITSGLPVSHSWPTPGRMAAFESQNRAIPLKTTLRVANHDVAAKTRV